MTTSRGTIYVMAKAPTFDYELFLMQELPVDSECVIGHKNISCLHNRH